MPSNCQSQMNFCLFKCILMGFQEMFKDFKYSVDFVEFQYFIGLTEFRVIFKNFNDFHGT